METSIKGLAFFLFNVGAQLGLASMFAGPFEIQGVYPRAPM